MKFLEKECVSLYNNFVSELFILLYLINDFCINKITLIIVALNVLTFRFFPLVLYKKIKLHNLIKKEKCQYLCHLLKVHSLCAVI